MTYQESLINVVKEFGRRVFSEPQLANILGDFNAYEESKSFKIITRLVRELSFTEKLKQVSNWNIECEDIITAFVKETGIQENQARYILSAMAFVLDLTDVEAKYENVTIPQQINSKGSVQEFNLGYKQLANMPEEFVQHYKEKAEEYLDSIIELKGDFAKLGASINISSEYLIYSNDSQLQLNIEIDGQIKVKHDYHIAFRYVLYNHAGRILASNVGLKNKSDLTYEVVTADSIDEVSFKNVGNIGKIVVYWEKL